MGINLASCVESGAPHNISPLGVLMIMSKVRYQPRTTQEELVNDFKARLKFDNEHLNDSEKAWEKMMWADET